MIRIPKGWSWAGVFGAAGYFALMLAGIAGLLVPPPAIMDAVVTVSQWIWAASLTTGGLLCGVSLATGRKGLELMGTPFVAVTIFFYGVALLVRQWELPGISGAGTVAAWILIGLSLFITGRYMFLRMEAKASTAASHRADRRE